MTSAPAAAAARASATVVTLANQAMPASFSRCTKGAGYRPMMDDTAVGRAARTASHWASKSCSGASAAAAGTAGPCWARNSRTAASFVASRKGGAGSGTHRLICSGADGATVVARNCATQAAMPGPLCSSAPIAPMPPACTTAADSATGQAPAMGANNTGTRSPKRCENA